MGLVGHLSRAAYGFARTVAFLPDSHELRASLAVPYAAPSEESDCGVSTCARKGFLAHPGKNRGLLLMLALLAVPFLAMGISYFPSDSERWLFLMPPLWLLIGLAWDGCEWGRGRRIIVWDSPILLAAIVIGLGTYNAAALLPDALANRYLAGLRELLKLTTSDDLVISPFRVDSRINEFYLNRPIQAENLTVMALAKQHGADLRGMQTDLADRIDRASCKEGAGLRLQPHR